MYFRFFGFAAGSTIGSGAGSLTEQSGHGTKLVLASRPTHGGRFPSFASIRDFGDRLLSSEMYPLSKQVLQRTVFAPVVERLLFFLL